MEGRIGTCRHGVSLNIWCERCQEASQGTWPIAKQWPDTAVAQMDGRWFRLAHIGDGRYEVVGGPFGTYQRALLDGQEA